MEPASAPENQSLHIHCDIGELSAVRDALKDFLADSFDRIDTNRIILSVDEALANIVEHAYAPDAPETQAGIDLSMQRTPALVRFIIEDRGPVFDPTRLPPPNLEEHARNTNDGGLGVFLYMTLMDEVRHEDREGGGNRLILGKRYARQDS